MAKRSRSDRPSKALSDRGVRFRLLVDSAIDYAIFMLDTEGRVVTWNAGAERIKGYRAEEIRGRHYSCFYPEEARRAGTPAHLLEVAASQGRCEDEGWRLRKDGSRFWANVVITAVRDGAGRLLGFSKVTRDLTERRRAQEALDERARALEEKTRALEAAQEALVRRERLAILGQLAGGLSHELRNPLGVVKNSAYFLRMVLPDDEPARKHLAIIEREVGTANRIVTALLDFARVSVPTRVPSDLNTVVRARLDRAAVPDAVTVAATLAEDLPLVAVDPEQIGLALGNLILNALQAMPGGGALTVETSWTARDVLIGVADTGVGIAPEHLDKIFEPLFTTKARGIGLGLSVVKRLLEANGGGITVESTPGQGSRFLARFPRASEDP
ncbi:MAG: hybrid sensor histidine kinase/response regulator [Candidatus Rokuibacteriota bacterium]|nr:MAG: hybrid sensor histidine kinase/response regulator [Candidatus Rokubacteria bacterium]